MARANHSFSLSHSVAVMRTENRPLTPVLSAILRTTNSPSDSYEIIRKSQVLTL
jgi:hypothetical protein